MASATFGKLPATGADWQGSLTSSPDKAIFVGSDIRQRQDELGVSPPLFTHEMRDQKV
jgi:hypothetical protein